VARSGNNGDNLLWGNIFLVTTRNSEVSKHNDIEILGV
jgi:hypothetical protein